MYFLQIKRLRIEIEKLQWLHQQELSEMKHNLGEKLIHQLEKTQISPPKCVTSCLCLVMPCRADHGRDEAESGAGEGAVVG